MAVMGVAEGIGYVSAALLMVMSVPQTIRAYRWGTAGVSALTWWTIAVAISMWLVYGIRTESLVLIIANIASLTATAAMLVVLTHASVERWVVPAFVVVGTLALVVAAALFAPLIMVAAAAVCLPIASRIPQLRQSVSSYRAGSPTSVSRTTWMLAATGQSGWLIYGLILGDPALITVNSICVAMAVTLVVADVANPGNRSSRKGGLPVVSGRVGIG